eukprot:scaffold15188_cov65-Phaeocystis_antarctica.AAC.4
MLSTARAGQVAPRPRTSRATSSSTSRLPLMSSESNGVPLICSAAASCGRMLTVSPMPPRPEQERSSVLVCWKASALSPIARRSASSVAGATSTGMPCTSDNPDLGRGAHRGGERAAQDSRQRRDAEAADPTE